MLRILNIYKVNTRMIANLVRFQSTVFLATNGLSKKLSSFFKEISSRSVATSIQKFPSKTYINGSWVDSVSKESYDVSRVLSKFERKTLSNFSSFVDS
jgi:hypothetical protein